MQQFGDVDSFVLFGKGDLLVETAVLLQEQGHDPLVVSSERQLHGELTAETNETLAEKLDAASITYLQSDDVSDDEQVRERISDGTVGISIGAVWLFDAEFIRLFDGKLVNLHTTLLPRNRGRAGVSWKILMNERRGGCLVHRITPEIDGGEILLADSFVYPDSCQIAADYIQVNNERSAALLAEFVSRIERGDPFEARSQPAYLGSYCPGLATDIHGFIDWSWDRADIVQFIRAFDEPYGGASTFYQDRRVRLKKAQPVTDTGGFHPFMNGLVYRVREDAVFVATNEGGIVLETITDEQGASIIDEITTGWRFHTPAGKLETAKQTRAFYTPSGLETERFDIDQ